MLESFNVLLGVSGGIACYKSCEIVSRLKKFGAGVERDNDCARDGVRLAVNFRNSFL